MKLGDHYREHGESVHLANVEARLTDEWQTTSAVAERSGRSRNYVAAALGYLHEEGRAARRQTPLEHPIFAQTWQWEWRLPT